jgi:hypothetical protein
MDDRKEEWELYSADYSSNDNKHKAIDLANASSCDFSKQIQGLLHLKAFVGNRIHFMGSVKPSEPLSPQNTASSMKECTLRVVFPSSGNLSLLIFETLFAGAER